MLFISWLFTEFVDVCKYEDFKSACDGITSEKLYFVVFYADMDTLKIRAEGNRLPVKLNPEKTHQRHKNFYDEMNEQRIKFQEAVGITKWLHYCIHRFVW